MQRHCVTFMTIDLTIVTLNFKTCPGYISETVKCRQVHTWLVGRSVGGGGGGVGGGGGCRCLK